jgi:hypothetical protein
MTGMHTKSVEKKLTGTRDQSGAVAVIVAAVLVGLSGFVALAVDVGHMVAVKAELQKAADAGALSGAVALSPYTGALPNLQPNWFSGRNAAANIINDSNNKADNQQSSIGISDVLSGYWLLNPQGQSQTLPQSLPSITYMPAPAIQVTLSRTVNLFFAPVIGASNIQNVSATAIAILPEVYSLPTGTFAMAVEQVIVDNQTTHSLILTPQDFGWHDHGQWFNTDGSNDVPTIRKNVPFTAGNPIYIAPGSKTTLYHDITPNQTVIVPVVASTNQKTWQDIIGFAAFYITGVSGNSIDGHFVDKYISPDAVPGAGSGTYYGVSGTPKLVGP